MQREVKSFEGRNVVVAERASGKNGLIEEILQLQDRSNLMTNMGGIEGSREKNESEMVWL